MWDALCQANAPPRPPRQAQSTPMAMRRGERRSRGTGVAMCAGVVADMAVKLWARLDPPQETHSTSVDNFLGVFQITSPTNVIHSCPQLLWTVLCTTHRPPRDDRPNDILTKWTQHKASGSNVSFVFPGSSRIRPLSSLRLCHGSSTPDRTVTLSTPGSVVSRQMHLTGEGPSQPRIHGPCRVAHHDFGRHIELFSRLVGIIRPHHE